MDPQQILFTQLLIRLREKGYGVYDGMLPPKGAKYPFIYLGDNQTVDTKRKGVIQGTVYQTIDVWHNNPRQRGVLSTAILDVKKICREIENESGWLIAECSSQIVPDNTTNEPLMHGIVTMGFKF